MGTLRKSILDIALDEARSLTATLGGDDRRKLDEYLYAVRDVEKQIQSAERGNTARVPVDAPSASVPGRFRRALATDDRPHGARVSDRHDARRHGPARHRAEPAELSGDRDYRRASRPDASPGRQAQDREGDADQRVPHQAVHLSARQIQIDPRTATARCSTIR